MKIIRKDGIEYEKINRKAINYDKKVCVKLNSTQVDKAIEKSKELDISFAEFIRRSIDLMLNAE